MSTLNEGRHAGEFIIQDSGTRSFKKVTIATTQVLSAGTVLGKLTSGGHHKPYDNDLSDGTQTAVGVLLDNVDTTGGAKEATIVDMDAVLNGEMLTFLTSGDVAAALVDLEARGIKVLYTE